MSYFAVALARNDDDWQGAELDLDDLETLDELADETDEVEPGDGIVVVLVEHDHWFGVALLDDGEEPRTYLSDAFEAGRTPIGRILLEGVEDLADMTTGSIDAEGFGEEEDEDDEDVAGAGSALPDGPVGDAELLAQLGPGVAVPAADLQVIATKTGLSPSEAIGEIADRLGAGGILEELR